MRAQRNKTEGGLFFKALFYKRKKGSFHPPSPKLIISSPNVVENKGFSIWRNWLSAVIEIDLRAALFDRLD